MRGFANDCSAWLHHADRVLHPEGLVSELRIARTRHWFYLEINIRLLLECGLRIDVPRDSELLLARRVCYRVDSTFKGHLNDAVGRVAHGPLVREPSAATGEALLNVFRSRDLPR